MSNAVEVKFGDWIQRGFDLFKDNMAVLIPVGLLAIIISVCTAGILAGPMAVGMILVILALLDKKEPKPDIGAVFNGFSFFLQSFLFCLVFGLGLFVIAVILSLIPCIGHVLLAALSVTAGTFLMFGLFLIADRKMEFWPAAVESYNKVKTNFWPFLGFAIITGLIAQVGGVVCCVGMFLTVPMAYCMIAVAYRDVFGPAA